MAFARIISKLEFENVSEIEVTSDLYKIIPTDKWEIDQPLTEETGSLEDDIASIDKMVELDRICTYVDFDRIASILRIISQVRNPPEE